ncbi:MAG: prolipoprotein diacylglyceryl transferase [Anaerolineae bacterium]|nr:prolipoprotein diacylglyceryl transferase [Phycisphaerae bacterium]
MMPILFHIPGTDIPIYSYGLMMVVGFLASIQLGKYLARRYGFDPELFVNIGLIALVTGVVGARLSHVLENLPEYTSASRSFRENLWAAINIRSGGLTYYGGFLLAFPSLLYYAIKKKIPLRFGMDMVAPCLMIGLAFGRIGCFLNGCCYGAVCEMPWAVTFPYASIPYTDQVKDGELAAPPELIKTDENRDRLVEPAELQARPALAEIAAHEHSLPLHPAQLYSAFTALLICALCLAYFTMPHAPGRVFALMLIVEGITRFLLELLRIEPPVVHLAGYGLSLSMVLGISFVALGLVLWILFGKRAPQPAQGFPVVATT